MTFFKSNSLVVILFVLLFAVNNKSKANYPPGEHQLTLYVMPTMYPLDWSGPASLYRTMKNCYVKTLGLADNYLLGHLVVKLESSLLPEPLLIAQTSGTVREKTDLILKQKVGFGIMGAPLTGRVESHKEIEHKLNVYAKREKLAFIKYRINETAMKRVLTFINKYKQKFNDKNAPCDFYGGAFWPRYANEGGSCSSFGIALLDLINLHPNEEYNWRLDLKIPKKLIGGIYNEGKKVKFTTMKNTKEWYKGDGELNKDFVKYYVYEPSIMYNWILENRNNNNLGYMPTFEGAIPGLFTDKTNIQVNSEAPYFLTRAEPNLFIDVYLKQNGISDKKN